MSSGQDLCGTGRQNQEREAQKERAAVAVESPAQAVEERWQLCGCIVFSILLLAGKACLLRLRQGCVLDEFRLRILRGPSCRRNEACPHMAAIFVRGCEEGGLCRL